MRWTIEYSGTMRNIYTAYAFPLRNRREHESEKQHGAKGTTVLWKKLHEGSTALFVTHTRNDFWNNWLGLNMSPTRHLIKLFSEKKHSTNICLFKVFTHTLGTGWYNNGLVLEDTMNKSWISAEITRKTSADEEYSKEDWAVVLESWNGSMR